MKKLQLNAASFINGDKSLRLNYPSVRHTGLEVSCLTIGDLKWITLPLPLHAGDVIKEISLNYRVSNSRSYISQIRLTAQESPDRSPVLHDDGTDLRATIPSNYKSQVSDLKVTSNILLSLRLNFTNTNDIIKIGNIEICYYAQSNSIDTGIFNVKDFGAIGNGITDDFNAFQDALKAIDDYASSSDYFGVYKENRGAILFVPPGHYKLKKTLVLERSIVLQGGGKAASCNLDFELPIDNSAFSGIVINGHTSTIKDIAVITANHYGRGLGKSITDDDQFEGERQSQISSGIVVRNGLITIENCYIAGFDHDGIHINSAASGDINANMWKVINCWLGSNGRHGLFVAGNDANAGLAIGTSSTGNLRYGYYDNSLGNCFVGCHAEANGTMSILDGENTLIKGGAFYIKSPNSVVVGAYPDAGEKLAIKHPALLLGGSVVSSQIEKIPSFDSNPPMILNGGVIEMNSFKETGTVNRYIRHLPEDNNNSEIYNSYNVLLVDATSGELNLTLPFSEADDWWNKIKNGFQVTIKKIDSTSNPINIRIKPNSVDRIENNRTEVTLNQPFSWITLTFEEQNVRNSAIIRKWYIIGKG